MAFLFFFVAGRPSIERSLLISSSAHAQSVPRPLRMRRDATWELLIIIIIINSSASPRRLPAKGVHVRCISNMEVVEEFKEEVRERERVFAMSLLSLYSVAQSV